MEGVALAVLTASHGAASRHRECLEGAIEHGQLIPFPDATLHLDPHFLEPEEAQARFAALLAEVPWARGFITLFGRRVAEPRLSCWMGDPGRAYRYSGVTRAPTPWTPTADALRERVSDALGVRFDSALLNLYRDGQDAMGWHADDEPELGPEPVIASLSLGATRDFRLRHRTRRDVPPITLALPPGSLLVMSGTTQARWQHALPRRTKVKEPRINVTFRQILR